MIADYEFYRETYYGDQLTAENFPKYADRADSHLDELTMGRYADDRLGADALTAVKKAECAIADLCLNLEQAELQSDAAWKVQSEKVGNHTVQFRNNAENYLNIFTTAGHNLFCKNLVITTGSSVVAPSLR